MQLSIYALSSTEINHGWSRNRMSNYIQLFYVHVIIYLHPNLDVV